MTAQAIVDAVKFELARSRQGARACCQVSLSFVMPGLVPGIHVFRGIK
jgi:hypothetical protein